MGSPSATMPLPFFYVGKTLTTTRIANYGTKHAILTTQLGKPDTKSVWYSRDHISQLLDEIDHAEGDGVRFFFGAYEDEHEDFGGQTCLLMVVTKEKIEGEIAGHENVALEDEPDFGDRSIRLRDSEANSGGRKKDFNHGSPCPPLCDGFEGFGYP